MKKRRDLLIALGASSLVTPFGSFAQQQVRVWRVGFLSARSRPDFLDSDVFGAFPRRMRELGYVEGKNLVIEWRFADNNGERLPSLAAELVQLKVDVIVAAANQAIGAAQKATTSIPIVMGNSADPAGSGLVKSLAHPGGNVTGLSNLSEGFSSKHLEMLRSIVPKLSRVAVLLDLANPSNQTILKSIRATAQNAGVTILPMEAPGLREIDSAFILMTKEKAQALIVVSNPLFLEQRRRISEMAMKHRLPLVGRYREYTEAGGLMSYGPNVTENYLRAATYVDKIFKGAKPADLPVEQPTKFELVINGKAAKALGLTIPQLLLISADKVIE